MFQFRNPDVASVEPTCFDNANGSLVISAQYVHMAVATRCPVAPSPLLVSFSSAYTTIPNTGQQDRVDIRRHLETQNNGPKMNELSLSRRRFLIDSTLTATAVALGRDAFGQGAASFLVLPSKGPALGIPANFIGLSYENMQLEDPSFFSPSNTGLIEQFKNISSRGVLRLGGNTSEFSWWQTALSQLPPHRTLMTQKGGAPENKSYAITPHTVRELDGFLRATGWSCIYGLNLGFGTPDTVLPEARAVFETLGPRLEYFQIGNEVDQFVSYGLRDAATWNADLYLEQWLTIARAVQTALPGAHFGLPDVASKVDWLTRIASLWPSLPSKPRVTSLSHHHYWSGPPSNPNATLARLLQRDPVAPQQARIAREAASSMAVQLRMTEGNTIFRGGKSGLSDVFAASLWAADYLLTLMMLGYSGVNLHGGSGHAQAVSVGGTFAGENEMKDPNQPHPKPFYTPIANEGTLAGSGVDGKLNGKYILEPCGYGMKFAASFAGATMLPVEFQTGSVNAVAYAARRKDGSTIIAILNKDEVEPIRVHLPGFVLHEVLWAETLTVQQAHLLKDHKAAAIVKIDNRGTVQIPKATVASFLRA